MTTYILVWTNNTTACNKGVATIW